MISGSLRQLPVFKLAGNFAGRACKERTYPADLFISGLYSLVMLQSILQLSIVADKTTISQQDDRKNSTGRPYFGKNFFLT